MSDTPENQAGERSAGDVQQQPAGAVTDTPPSQIEPPVRPAPPVQPRLRGASSWRAFRDPLLIGILLTALVADQVTKQLILNSLGPGMSWPDSGFFRFTFVRNDGTAFGLFQDNGALLTVVSLGAVALIVYFYREAAMASWFTRAALGLQLGGAAGNLTDRFRHGYVVDFIDVGTWPIFNIADSSIMVGIISLIAYFTLMGGRNQPLGGRTAGVGEESGLIGDSAGPNAAIEVPPSPPSIPAIPGSVARPESRD